MLFVVYAHSIFLNKVRNTSLLRSLLEHSLLNFLFNDEPKIGPAKALLFLAWGTPFQVLRWVGLQKMLSSIYSL